MTVRRLIAGKGGFVSVAPPDALVKDIVDQLENDDVAAVVVSKDGRAIEGIVSGRTIASGLKLHGKDVLDRPVSEIMTREVVTCDIGEPLKTVYELMDRHHIRHVPITENGELCGIINMLDVVRYRLSELSAEAEALKEYVSGRA